MTDYRAIAIEAMLDHDIDADLANKMRTALRAATDEVDALKQRIQAANEVLDKQQEHVQGNYPNGSWPKIHPAYWQGAKDAVEDTVELVRDALNGEDDE